MTFARSSGTVRRIAALCMVAFAMTMQPHASVAKTADSVAELQLMHEARLRKLHLVRPDLINYPISFDAVC